MRERKPIVCIVGPTASGKTALSQHVALSLDAEIVSADSMQIYRGMNIGTGKVKPAEQLVAHHCLDIADPGEPFSAALFQEHARSCFEAIYERGKRAILCGGTGFYVRAAIDDYEFPKGEQVDNEIRDHYTAVLRDQGPQYLWDLLDATDPESAAIIPVNDSKRVIRAFELLDDGTTYARQRERLASIGQKYPATFIGLRVAPEVLLGRIDKRVDEMVGEGLVDEVRMLLEGGFRAGITSPQAIGYKEIVRYLDGECGLAEAILDIKVATRRYAKRQRTWFRKDTRITWIDANEFNVEALTRQALDIVSAAEARTPSGPHSKVL